MEKLPANIFETLKETCKKYPRREAVYFKKNGNFISLSYQDLYDEINKLSALLSENNIKKQDAAAIILENGPCWPIAFFSLMRLGIVAVPLNPQLEPAELARFIIHSECKLVFTSLNLSLKIRGALGDSGIKIITLDSETISQELEKFKTAAPENETSGTDIASVIYTSGTTSIPKGVILSHKNFLANLNALLTTGLINTGDCLICVLPFYHAYPFMVTLLLPLATGARISFPSQLDVQEIMDCVKKTGVTIFTGVPRLFSLFYEKIEKNIQGLNFAQKNILNILLGFALVLRKCFNINLGRFIFSDLHARFGKGFRFMISGGAKLKPEIIRSFYKWGFVMLEGYGLTEASPVVSFNLPSACKIGSVGKPFSSLELKINEPDALGTGEILIKGDNVTAGYYKEPRLTQEAIKDGWFATGDLGYKDKDGFLYITGRKKELLVLSSGKKIMPEDLENYYTQSPFIKELCVFLPADSQTGTDILTAVILPEDKYFLVKEVTQIKDKIRWEIERLSLNLPAYQRIKKYTITTEPLPRTILGKLKRYEIEEKYSALTLEEKAAKIPDQPDKELLFLPSSKKLLDYFSAQFKKSVNLDDHMELDLGLDSLARIDLFLEFQKITGVKIKERETLEIVTVRDLLNKAKAACGETGVTKDFTDWKKILKSGFDEKIKKTSAARQSGLTIMASLILLNILKITSRIFFFLEVEGAKNLPGEGPCLICPNHSSYLDGPLLISSLKPSFLLKTYFLGYSAYLNHPLLSWAKKPLRLIPIDPALNLAESLKTCSFILNQGRILCLFPEGARSLDGKIREFKRGAGILIQELNIPVVPVYIKGAYQAWPPYRIFPKPNKVKIIFGKKLDLQELTADAKEGVDIYEGIADKLREKVMALAS